MLTKGNWKNMEKLYLFNLYGGANRVGYLGVCELCLGDWDDLLFLSISFCINIQKKIKQNPFWNSLAFSCSFRSSEKLFKLEFDT